MLEHQPSQAHQDLILELKSSVKERVLNAEIVTVLRDQGDKTVELVRDDRASVFVRRSYTQQVVNKIEWAGVPFGQALAEMQSIFNNAGIELVSSEVILPSPHESDYPVIVATEYLEGEDMLLAPTKAKVQLASGLGAILGSTNKFIPSLEVFMADMFRAGKGKTADKLLLVDIDPYLTERELLTTDDGGDKWYAIYIDRISGYIWDKWCLPSQREVVMTAFVREAMTALAKLNSLEGSNVIESVAVAHSMANGFDLRS